MKEQSQAVTKLLSNHHRELLNKFLDFKDRTTEMMAAAEEQKEYLDYLEKAYVLKTPVMEAEHALDERTALSLYDCLIPKLREHRRFHIKVDEKFSIADFKA